MTTKSGPMQVRCPRCQYFVLAVFGGQFDLEVNCPADRCSTTLRVVVENGRVAIEATPKQKKA